MSARPTFRSGFTLIEVLLALTLTAVAATVAGAALHTARQASTRMAAFREQALPAQQWRDALQDVLRHAPPAERADEPLFAVRQGADSDTLTFLSRGVQQPFGTGPVWRVRVYADSAGLTLRAEPVYTSVPPSDAVNVVEWRVPAARELTVTLASFEGRGMVWRRDWPLERARPAGVRLAWRGADGEPVEHLVSLLPFAEAVP